METDVPVMNERLEKLEEIVERQEEQSSRRNCLCYM